MTEAKFDLAAAMKPTVELALTEDVAVGDVTTEAVVGPARTGRARILAKEEGVIAGLAVAEMAFRHLDPRVVFEARVSDGDRVAAGTVLARVSGRLRAILTAERVALNFLGRLSGIATATRRAVEAVAGTGAAISDTRKTTPGLRLMEKYAVAVGGGVNHRFGLYDGFLVKDNHIAAAGSLGAAVRAVREHGTDLPLEVECDSPAAVKEALDLDVPRILLDNLRGDGLRRALELVAAHRAAGGTVEVEVSGGVTLETVRDAALPGVNVISMGSLTHSPRSLDVSLDVESEEGPS
jgi:nicotinate-nucleotide pyrophosphorylase (carboxylating)